MKFCFLSDTHLQLHNIEIEPCDFVIHCGDLTGLGEPDKVFNELSLLAEKAKKAGAKYVGAIAGNHDFALANKINCVAMQIDLQKIHPNFRIFNDSFYEPCTEFNVYGFPWTIQFGNWAFMYPLNDGIERFLMRNIPQQTQIFVSHGPAHGILDTPGKPHDTTKHCGSPVLKEILASLPDLKVHAFGHIHGSYGSVKVGNYEAINASNCTEEYAAINPPTYREIEP